MTITLNRATLLVASLAISPLNARASRTEVDDMLTESIRQVGLMHPLVVHSLTKGGKAPARYGVLAGGRRLLSLQAIDAESNDPLEVEVTIAEGSDEELGAASLAENFQREPMTDIEIYKAVRTARKGTKHKMTDEMWAQAFGVPMARMRRILRLAHIHPAIMDAYEAEKITTQYLQTFGKIENTDEQKQWFDKINRGELQYWQLNAALGFGNHEHSHALKVVGVEAYQAAGGRLETDLFADETDARVLDPELLQDLVTKKLGEKRDEVKALYSERTITFTDEAPGGYSSYELRAEPALPAEKAEQWNEAILHLSNLEDEAFEEMLSEDVGTIDGYHDADNIDQLPREEVLSFAHTGKKTALKKLLATMDEQRKIVTEIEVLPKVLPEAATVCVLSFGRSGEIETSWYFPDRKSAGLTARNDAGAVAQEAQAKPGEEGFDPDNPKLTQRAVDHIKAMRARQAGSYLASNENAAHLAHAALLFSYARSIVSSYWERDSGMVISYGGSVYPNPGTALETLAAPDVPGIKNADAVAGWLEFKAAFNPAMLDRLAAWIFARKVNPEIGCSQQRTIASDVLAELADKRLARAHVQPDMTTDFFGLFPKKVLGEFAQTIGNTHKISVLAGKGDAPAKYMADMHLAAEPMSFASDWLPSFLRWDQPAPPVETTEEERALVAAVFDREDAEHDTLDPDAVPA